MPWPNGTKDKRTNAIEFIHEFKDKFTYLFFESEDNLFYSFIYVAYLRLLYKFQCDCRVVLNILANHATCSNWNLL